MASPWDSRRREATVDLAALFVLLVYTQLLYCFFGILGNIHFHCEPCGFI